MELSLMIGTISSGMGLFPATGEVEPGKHLNIGVQARCGNIVRPCLKKKGLVYFTNLNKAEDSKGRETCAVTQRVNGKLLLQSLSS
jgi:hypothetical protein